MRTRTGTTNTLPPPLHRPRRSAALARPSRHLPLKAARVRGCRVGRAGTRAITTVRVSVLPTLLAECLCPVRVRGPRRPHTAAMPCRCRSHIGPTLGLCKASRHQWQAARPAWASGPIPTPAGRELGHPRTPKTDTTLACCDQHQHILSKRHDGHIPTPRDRSLALPSIHEIQPHPYQANTILETIAND